MAPHLFFFQLGYSPFPLIAQRKIQSSSKQKRKGIGDRVDNKSKKKLGRKTRCITSVSRQCYGAKNLPLNYHKIQETHTNQNISYTSNILPSKQATKLFSWRPHPPVTSSAISDHQHLTSRHINILTGV